MIQRARRLRCSGFSLIELMVSLIIGLLIVLAVLNLFLASTRTHKTTENLSRIQENARIAFELIAFDLRQAGGTPCGNIIRSANNIESSTAAPWFTTGIRGYESSESFGGSSASSRAAGTDALTYGLASSTGVAVEEQSSGASSELKVSTVDHGLSSGDIALVCDNNLAAWFQVTNISDHNTTVVHNTGNTESPGNCARKFVPGKTCTEVSSINGAHAPSRCGVVEEGRYYEFCNNSVLTRYASNLWFVGCNGRVACNAPGGRSLYQAQFPNASQEVVPDVQDMQIQYLKKGASDYVDATAVTDWADVEAAKVSLTLVGPDDGATTDSDRTQRLTRTVNNVIYLRNQ
jgi:type IV pilus assembly protein PilW